MRPSNLWPTLTLTSQCRVPWLITMCVLYIYIFSLAWTGLDCSTWEEKMEAERPQSRKRQFEHFEVNHEENGIWKYLWFVKRSCGMDSTQWGNTGVRGHNWLLWISIWELKSLVSFQGFSRYFKFSSKSWKACTMSELLDITAWPLLGTRRWYWSWHYNNLAPAAIPRSIGKLSWDK